MNAEVNSGNRKAVLASNFATRIRGRNAALRGCIMIKLFAQHAKELNFTRTLIPFDMRSNAKVEVYVLREVLRGCQSAKKRPRDISSINMPHQHGIAVGQR